MGHERQIRGSEGGGNTQVDGRGCRHPCHEVVIRTREIHSNDPYHCSTRSSTGLFANIMSLSCLAMRRGSSCCHTFLPTASPVAPASIAPLTCIKKSLSVGALGPPDM